MVNDDIKRKLDIWNIALYYLPRAMSQPPTKMWFRYAFESLKLFDRCLSCWHVSPHCQCLQNFSHLVVLSKNTGFVYLGNFENIFKHGVNFLKNVFIDSKYVNEKAYENQKSYVKMKTIILETRTKNSLSTREVLNKIGIKYVLIPVNSSPSN